MNFDVELSSEIPLNATLSVGEPTIDADVGTVVQIGGGTVIEGGAGERVEGKTFTVDDQQITASAGAERFNSYSGDEQSIATGECARASGGGTLATGSWSDASGYATTASGNASNARGYATVASGHFSTAEGTRTTASRNNAHAEGDTTEASGNSSHSEGYKTKATINMAHAEGAYSEANGLYSHAEGYNTRANSSYQHVEGKWNVADGDAKYLTIVGNGTSEEDRSNAYTLDKDGNAWFKGNVYVGGADQNDGTRLATVDEAGTSSGSNGWVLIGDVISEGTEGAVGISVAVDFTEWSEIYAEAVGITDSTLTFRTLLSTTNDKWYDGQTIASRSAGNATLFSMYIINILGGLKIIAGYNTGYSSGTSTLFANNPRTSWKDTDYKYIRFDTQNTGDMPAGVQLTVWGKK